MGGGGGAFILSITDISHKKKFEELYVTLALHYILFEYLKQLSMTNMKKTRNQDKFL